MAACVACVACVALPDACATTIAELDCECFPLMPCLAVAPSEGGLLGIEQSIGAGQGRPYAYQHCSGADTALAYIFDGPDLQS